MPWPLNQGVGCLDAKLGIDKVAVFVDDGESVGLTVIDPVGLFVCVAILDINPEILGEVDSVVYQLAVLILEGVLIAERL